MLVFDAGFSAFVFVLPLLIVFVLAYDSALAYGGAQTYWFMSSVARLPVKASNWTGILTLFSTYVAFSLDR